MTSEATPIPPAMGPEDTPADASRLPRRLLLQGMGTVPLLAFLGACGGADEAGAGDDNATLSSLSAMGSADVEAPADDAQGDAAMARISAARGFVHPGLLHTETDFKRMRDKVEARAQPWAGGWDALISSDRCRHGLRPDPREKVVRGSNHPGPQNFATMVKDMQSSYQLALRWKISGDTVYADQAVQYLNAWSSTMKELTGDADRFLAAGIYGYQWANAAEIMRTYSGWASGDIKRFQRMLLELFYPLSLDFLTRHNGTETKEIGNYWANWDLCSLAGMVAIGIFCDRRDIYDTAITYYKNGRGNGAAAHNVYYLHPGHLGQFQESGRDQGHATLCIALAGALCEMAWNQGEDLYGHANNRFLAGAEYVAKSNLRDGRGIPYEMPFSTYTNKHGRMMAVSPAGRPFTRACWESVYNHYVNRKGLSAPWVAAMTEQSRLNQGAGNGDQPGFGRLTFSRDPIATGAPPSGLVATVSKGRVSLSWWGSAHAQSYNVKRGPSVNGPFTKVASVTDPRTCVDTPGKGVWFYIVTAVGSRGESAAGTAVRASTIPELLARLPLNGGSGATAVDTSGRSQNGQLSAGARWGEGRKGGKALSLDGKGGHLAFPNGILNGTREFTISLWVNWKAADKNTRIFDFGSGDVAYMALMPRGGDDRMRFMITGSHWRGEQAVVAPCALPTGRWVHVAVTLSGSVAKLYMDGELLEDNPAIEFTPDQLGSTTQNWLGRSQYNGDPSFNGLMQDLRICSGALTAAEIKLLAAA